VGGAKSTAIGGEEQVAMQVKIGLRDRERIRPRAIDIQRLASHGKIATWTSDVIRANELG
jgi:hypothetical protein